MASGTCLPLKAAGATCQSASECAFGLGCTGTTTTRTCAPLPTLGQACPDFQCRDEGTYCNSAGTCAKVGLPGTACATAQDCSSFYRCDQTVLQCARYPMLGESCAVLSRCFDAASYCDSTTLMCTALKSNGATCNSNTQCSSNNCNFTATSPVCSTPEVCI
jgi:hypothetical protein